MRLEACSSTSSRMSELLEQWRCFTSMRIVDTAISRLLPFQMFAHACAGEYFIVIPDMSLKAKWYPWFKVIPNTFSFEHTLHLQAVRAARPWVRGRKIYFLCGQDLIRTRRCSILSLRKSAHYCANDRFIVIADASSRTLRSLVAVFSRHCTTARVIY